LASQFSAALICISASFSLLLFLFCAIRRRFYRG
jgi:hypothetical protein